MSTEGPSAPTSHNFTDSDAYGPSAAIRNRTRGCPSSTSPAASHSHVSECASSSRWSIARPKGRAPATPIPAVPAPADPRGDTGVRTDREPPVARQRTALDDAASRRPLVADPPPGVLVEVGLGRRRAAHEQVDLVPGAA